MPYTRKKRFLPVRFGLRCGVSIIPDLPIKRLLPKSPKRLPQLCSSPSLLRGRSAPSPMLVDYYAPPSPRSLMPILIVCCRGCLWIIGAYPYSLFLLDLGPPVVGCLAGRPSHSMIREIPLRNKPFSSLSTINSLVSAKSVVSVESFLGSVRLLWKVLRFKLIRLIIN